MKKTILLFFIIVIMSCFCFTGCNSIKVDKFEIEKESIEVYVGKTFSVDFELVASSEDVDITVTSSNEDVVKAYRFWSAKYYDMITSEGKKPGTSTITVTAGDKTDSFDVVVLFDPEIRVYGSDENCFTIFTEFPADTKLKVSLSNENYNEEQTVTLLENIVAESEAIVFFNNKEETLNGKFNLKIELADMSIQPQILKDLIGENGQFVKMEDTMHEFSYNLPYKTLTEIIRETDYKDLTVSQQMTIIRWIDRRFEYYDDLQGSYQGLKWKGVIFNEAAEEFNKTYNEVHTIYYGYC